MKFNYADLETCPDSIGLVVVIDVIRAFTTAAVALARGADRIIPVGTFEEALEKRGRSPAALAIGEIKGLPPAGFDSGNSPTRLMDLDLVGRTIFQRTGAGTQGIVRSTRAEQMLAASFVVASATVRYIRVLAPEEITFVITGQLYDGGEEDLACASYLEACLRGESPDPAPYLERVRRSHDARVFHDPTRPEFPETDLMYCTSLDLYDFAMPVTREADGLVIRKVIQ